MARVVLIAGVALVALGIAGIVWHLLRRGPRRELRRAADLYQRALSSVGTDVDESVEIGREALAAWTSAGTPAATAGLRARIVGRCAEYAERLRQAGRPADALTQLTAAQAALAEPVDADPQRFRPLLAEVLTGTAAAEADLGHAEEALRHDGRLVPLLRDLAEDHPSRYARPLGLALAAEARHFHDVGRTAEALAAAQEATRQLRQADPSALARAGADHAAILLSAGRDEDALVAVNEAVAQGARSYDGVTPEGFRHCVTLTVLGRCLLGLGRAPLAEAPLRDALGLARSAYARPIPGASVWLADVLTATAETLTTLDRPGEAVAAAEEAAALCPGDGEPRARALWTLAAALLADGRPGDARTPAADAVGLYKRLGRFPREQARAEELLSRL